MTVPVPVIIDPFAKLRREMRGGKGPKRQQHERKVQQAIVAFHAAVVVDPASALLFSCPNGEKRDAVTAALLSGSRRAREVRQVAFEGCLAPAVEDDDSPALLLPGGLGVLPGAPDLLLLLPGPRTVLIEVKSPGGPGHRAGRSSAAQRRFQRAAEAMGHAYVLLDSTDAYEALLRAEGVALRGSAAGVKQFLPTMPSV